MSRRQRQQESVVFDYLREKSKRDMKPFYDALGMQQPTESACVDVPPPPRDLETLKATPEDMKVYDAISARYWRETTSKPGEKS